MWQGSNYAVRMRVEMQGMTIAEEVSPFSDTNYDRHRANQLQSPLVSQDAALSNFSVAWLGIAGIPVKVEPTNERNTWDTRGFEGR